MDFEADRMIEFACFYQWNNVSFGLGGNKWYQNTECVPITLGLCSGLCIGLGKHYSRSTK